MESNKIESPKGLNIAIKIGSIAFVVWGILHVYVGYMGISGYIVDPNKGLLSSFLGGANAPVDKFQFATFCECVGQHGHEFTVELNVHTCQRLFECALASEFP